MRNLWSQRHKKQPATGAKAARGRVTVADVARLAAQFQTAADALAAWARDLDAIPLGTAQAEQRAARALAPVQQATHAIRQWLGAIGAIDSTSRGETDRQAHR